jgi:hypothetical protein
MMTELLHLEILALDIKSNNIFFRLDSIIDELIELYPLINKISQSNDNTVNMMSSVYLPNLITKFIMNGQTPELTEELKITLIDILTLLGLIHESYIKIDFKESNLQLNKLKKLLAPYEQDYEKIMICNFKVARNKNILQSIEYIRELREKIIPYDKRASLSVLDLRTKSYLIINEIIHFVEDIYIYTNHNYDYWIELKLFNILSGETFYLDYKVLKDKLFISLSMLSTVSMDELGIDIIDVQSIVSSGRGKIILNNGESFYFLSYCDVKFQSISSIKSEEISILEFESELSLCIMKIRELSDDSYKVYFSEVIDQTILEIIAI